MDMGHKRKRRIKNEFGQGKMELFVETTKIMGVAERGLEAWEGILIGFLFLLSDRQNINYNILLVNLLGS